MSSAICSNLDQPKILSSGNGLSLYHTIQNFNNRNEKGFASIVGKEENTGN